MGDSPSAALAALPGRLGREPLPDRVVEQAKQLIADAVGCGLAGTHTPIGEAVLSCAALAPGSSTVIGAPEGAALLEAVFINASLVNALDFDDTSTHGHPGATVLPAALAVAEHVDASGAELVGAVALGYHACERIARAVRPTAEREREVSGSAPPQVFGAALAAAALLGLDEEATARALGVAGAFAPLPSGGRFGWDDNGITWVKDNVARPAEAGVRAALLARQGYVGHRRFLDGDSGFWRMIGSDRWAPDELLEGLWPPDLDAVAIKPYPCCRWMHAALDAAAQLCDEGPLAADDIARVEVHTVEACVRHLGRPDPGTAVDAQFSLPHCVALMLLGVPVERWQRPDCLARADVRALAQRVSMHLDLALQRVYLERGQPDTCAPARLRRIRHDGRADEVEVRDPRSLDGAEVERKLLSNARPTLGEPGADALLRRITALDRGVTARSLARALVPGDR